jgi:hypothetical protein
VGDADRSPYGVVNLLDNKLEIDIYSMNIEGWSDFVRGRSCADQKRMTVVKGTPAGTNDGRDAK